MPKDKKETHERILSAAKKEFMEKGFEQASMRSIASAVNMSAAGLYRHFADKEEMFSALVEPAVSACKEWFEEHKAWDYEQLEQNQLDVMWESGADLTLVKEIIYPHFDAFKLLLCRSEGTRYADYLHEMVLLEQRETLIFMEEARKRGIPVKEVRPEEIHLLMSAYVTALFEVVVHDFPKEDAEHYLETFQAFFCPGWRAVLGL